MDLNAWLASKQLVVCVGSGGVGKTTTAATIGLRGALLGKRAMVLTIDPARRLANSLGLSSFGGEAKKIDLSALPDAKGELWAAMLDSQGTFDDVIARVAPSDEVRERILGNAVYRYMADTFAGSQDYMATEKLFDLASSGRFDLVVLDTPPVKNALDFLESPGRVVNFLDQRVLSWFLAPRERKGLGRVAVGTSAVVWRLLAYIFGRDFLDDLETFFHDFQGLYEGFRERHDAVMAMLRAPTTGFVTVCAPTEPSIDVATFFQDELAARALPRSGVVVNQVHRCEGTSHDAAALLGRVAREVGGDLPASVVPSVLARLGMAHRRLCELSKAEQALNEQVRRAARNGGFYQEVPRLLGEVHTLEALNQVGVELFDREATTL